MTGALAVRVWRFCVAVGRAFFVSVGSSLVGFCSSVRSWQFSAPACLAARGRSFLHLLPCSSIFFRTFEFVSFPGLSAAPCIEGPDRFPRPVALHTSIGFSRSVISLLLLSISASSSAGFAGVDIATPIRFDLWSSCSARSLNSRACSECELSARCRLRAARLGRVLLGFVSLLSGVFESAFSLGSGWTSAGRYEFDVLSRICRRSSRS